jgi:hypothetical protein
MFIAEIKKRIINVHLVLTGGNGGTPINKNKWLIKILDLFKT